MNAVETIGATVTAATTETTVAVAATPKTPSKKSLAQAIFDAKMVERTQGLYASNKEFRAAVLRAIETDLGVSTASSATMYNSAKAEVEATGTVKLGRDPKKVKDITAGTGKRGRPSGSVNKKKEVVVTDATAEVHSTEAVAA